MTISTRRFSRDRSPAPLADETSRRSGTIMILRRERDGGAALLSIPRDLWVEIPGSGEAKNDPFAAGRLIDAVVESVRIDESIDSVGPGRCEPPLRMGCRPCSSRWRVA